MNGYVLLIFVVILFSYTGAVAESPTDNTQKIYKYQDDQGIPEFTDTIKTDKEPVKKLQIEKMSEEEKARSEAKLEQIREKDQQLDERVRLQRQREYERNKKTQRSDNTPEADEQDYSDSYYWRHRRRFPGKIERPDRPLKPRPKPLPIKPRPGKPGSAKSR